MLSLLSAGRVTAQLTVTSTGDNGPGTLRAALASAANGDTIDATGVAGTILLTSGELAVTNSVIILGPGPANLAVNGNAAHRVFNISGALVTIAGLTITNGTSSGFGGGILAGPGTLTVSNCGVSGNSARYGGGIFGNHSILSVSTCTFSGNTAMSNGGGIFIIDNNNGGAMLTVSNCTLIGNVASNDSGGGIYNYSLGSHNGTMQIVGSTFTGNLAGYGAAIYNDGRSRGNATLTVSASTISSNSASRWGGGIYNNGTSSGTGIVQVTDSTLIGNVASNDCGGGIYNSGQSSGNATMQIVNSALIANSAGYGAGIYNTGYSNGHAALTVSASTLTANSASGYGGGIFSSGNSGHATLTVSASILSRNSAGTSGAGIFNQGYSGNATLTVSASTLNNNSAGYGAGLYNNGESGQASLTVSSSTLSGNSATVSGGGIYNNSEAFGNGTVQIANSTLSGNSANFGGGIYNDGTSFGNAMLTVSNSTLSGNSAGNSGGGILNDGTSYGTGTVQVVASTLTGNSASYGSGIYNDGQSGKAPLTVSGSTVTANSASVSGGIYNNGESSGNAMLTVSNSTLSGNSAGYGAGIYNDGTSAGTGTVQVAASTLSGNSASYGGGIYNNGYSGSAPLTVRNSTLSGNSAGNSGGIFNNGTSGNAHVEIGSTILNSHGNIVAASGTVSSDGYNLANDDGGGFLTGPADQINIDPMLGPLQDNGGPTFTHALLPGSPAIDMGKNFNGSATDQRGLPRTLDGSCITNAPGGDGTDIGTFELQHPCPVTLPLFFTVLHGFTAAQINGDGANPSVGLILSGSTLYGTAFNGGSSGAGTLFAVNTDGTAFTNLHSFSYSDGVSPSSGLILSSNTLYGTAFNGGSSGNGVVFAMSTDGTGLRNLHSFAQLVIPCMNGSCPSNYWCVGGICVPINGSPCLNGTCPPGYQCNGSVCVVPSGGGGCPGGCGPCAHCVCLVDRDGNPIAPCYCATDGAFGGYCGGYAAALIPASQATAETFISINFDGAHPLGGLVLSNNTLYGTTTAGGSSGAGTVFAVNTDGTGLTLLHNFTGGSDGANPGAGLILSGNTLYGTAYSGGPFGYGTMFAVNTDGTGFSILHSFAGNDGANPRGGLILSSNTLYGTAQAGGSWGHGAVFAVSIDGTGFTNLYSFTGATDGAAPSAGLIISGSTLCGTAIGGGTFGYGTVFAVNTDGTGFTNIYSFTGATDGANPSGGLTLSGNTLYGTTTSGGSSGNGTVFSISFTPQLTITPSGANVILSWPTNRAGFDYTGYTLQYTTNLFSPAAWVTNSSAPVVINGQHTVTNVIAGSQQFYRLIH